MNALYLSAIILGISMQDVVRKLYNKRTNGGVYLFGALTAISALGFFLAVSGGVSFDPKVLPYSCLFALAYCSGTVFSLLAIKWGSLSLTTLIISFSLLLPTLYGVVYLKESVGFGFFIGLGLLIVSLVLISGKSDRVKLSLKWVLAVLLAFLSNGACTIIQKMQQVRFEGEYKSELMIFTLCIVAVFMLVMMLVKERGEIREAARRGAVFALLCGVFNGLVNLFVMILSGRMNSSVMFPLVSGGGIILTYFVSRFIFKETLSKRQLTGLLFGIASVVFLNL